MRIVNKRDNKIDRDSFLKKMHEHGIGTGVHYRSIPSHSFYKKKYGWKKSHYKNASQIGDQTVSIPLSPKLTKTDVDRIILTIKKILNNA